MSEGQSPLVEEFMEHINLLSMVLQSRDEIEQLVCSESIDALRKLVMEADELLAETEESIVQLSRRIHRLEHEKRAIITRKKRVS